MANQNTQSPQLLALITSQAAHFADELVCDPVDGLVLNNAPTAAHQKSQASYSQQRNQALTRGRTGYSIVPRFKTEMDDPDAGRGETSAQLLARRLR